ncbi:MAG TPA: hypothetical protein VGK94_06655 [Candidatus Polarisedimenticolia bacterium]|jgi:hypothetical protein
MNVRAIIPAVLCAMALAPAAHGAARGPSAIEMRLTGAAGNGAAGVALLRITEAAMRFSVRVEGLPAGAYELRVGGLAQGLVFVDSGGAGEILFDTKLFEKAVAEPRRELEAMPLSFDPRGKLLQIVGGSGEVVLEAAFPARPPAGRR